MTDTPTVEQLRSDVFAILRRHDVSEQCFAEVAMVTHAFRTKQPRPDASVDGLAGEMFEQVRDIWHYARRGTADGNMFAASERGQMLMRSMKRLAAIRALAAKEVE